MTLLKYIDKAFVHGLFLILFYLKGTVLCSLRRYSHIGNYNENANFSAGYRQ